MTMSGWIDPAPVLRASEWLLSLLVTSSAQAAVVLAAAALSALVLRRGSAAWRHLVRAVAVTGSLCLPVISAFLPAWRVPLATSWPGSHGPGVQTLVKLKDGSGAIRLTSAYYELPRGGVIDKREGKTSWGVDPTDGYHVPADGKTQDAMTRKRLDRERVGGPDPAGAVGVKVTPESIERDQADPQLAAALTTLLARTTRGEFAKVGLPVSEQAARIRRLEEARQRRQSHLDDLKKVDEELGERGPVSGDRE
jgi:hypothetical protein